MAFAIQRTCMKCGNVFDDLQPASGYMSLALCSDCEKTIVEEEKQKYFAKLDKMTIEERLRRLEEKDFTSHKNISYDTHAVYY